MKHKKIIGALSLFSLLILALPKTVYAVCPICTVAVGAGLGLSRYLGIDDVISGFWVGGLIMSLSFWLSDWATKKWPKKLKNTGNGKLIFFSILFWYAITFIPLWMSGIIGHPFNTILGMDKLIFGSINGSLIFLLAIWADKKVRKIKGKQLIQFQKVIFPLFALALISLIVYFYGGYLY